MSAILLVLSGDIEITPGPPTSSVNSSNASSFDDSCTYQILRLQELITFSCINIQSVKSKLDIVEAELGDRDVIMSTETWLKPNVPNVSLSISNFKEPYRFDRIGDKIGGGVMIYVKSSIPSKRRRDLEVPTLECVWVELTVHNTKILLGLFYRPPDSNVLIWDLINQSFENAANTGIDKIMVMGDFNDNQLQALLT